MRRHLAHHVVLVLLVAVGCSKSDDLSSPRDQKPSDVAAPQQKDRIVIEGEAGPAGPKITREQAVETALKRLRQEKFAEEIDTTRMTVYHGTYGRYGPSGEAPVRWVIDFARRGVSEITPGQWERGYQVVVDPETGIIIEAYGYKR